MAASPSSALLRPIPCFATLVQVLILHQARLLPLAVAKTNLTTDETLTPPEYITSPSGDFAFGFRAHDSDPAMFILATWCRFIGDDGNSIKPLPQSVVWFAKESNDNMRATPNATARSVLGIQRRNGQLTLTDGGTDLWTAMAFDGRRGNVVVLSDSGNVQFLGDGGEVLWQSFTWPTDTLLPGQSFQGALFSKRAEAEFTTGRFSLAAQADGNIVLCKDLFTGDTLQNAVWALNTNGGNSNTTITMDNKGNLNYILYVDGTVNTLISPVAMPSADSSNYFQFARVDTDGIVRTYFRPKNSSHNTSWTVSGRYPTDGGCNMKLQGMCGPGSYCVETMDRLDCLCPPGYTYIDAQHRDSGCTPEFEPQSCGGAGDANSDNSSEQFKLVELPNTTWDWEFSMYYKKFPLVTVKQCQEYCLNDCYCAAALMVNGSYCTELAALTNGRKADNILMPALIKVRKGNTTTTYMERPSSARTKTIRPYKIVAICLASLLFITVGVVLAQYYYYIVRKRRDRQQSLSSSAVRAFSWKELYQATNGFKELLGRGSFGEVYKGTMRSSPQPLLIAVKKLIDSNDYSEQEFTNEVQSIGQIHHRNLVRMIGYCKQGKHRMLVFEFMPGGSLRSFLFKAEKRLPWRQRAEAALAVARGIEYLHDGCSTPVIHCDIKPDNILMDDHGIARITDFGISKLLGSQQVHTTVTHVRGTRGYIAPEWLRGDARVDTKVDVYSFGVVLLELISCRRCQDPLVNYLPPGAGAEDDDESETTVTLFGWAAQLVVARRTELMLHHDADDVGTDGVGDMEQVEQFARVALWCMEPNPLLRPTMHQVVQMLETSDWAQVQALPDPAECYMESSPLIIPQLIKIE